MMIVPARSLIGISDGYPGSDFIENKSKAAYFNKTVLSWASRGNDLRVINP